MSIYTTKKPLKGDKCWLHFIVRLPLPLALPRFLSYVAPRPHILPHAPTSRPFSSVFPSFTFYPLSYSPVPSPRLPCLAPLTPSDRKTDPHSKIAQGREGDPVPSLMLAPTGHEAPSAAKVASFLHLLSASSRCLSHAQSIHNRPWLEETLAP